MSNVFSISAAKLLSASEVLQDDLLYLGYFFFNSFYDTLIKHLYDQLQDQGVELDNTGRRYALALAQFHELTGAEVPQHHDWEGLRDQLGSIRNKKIMVTIPRDRDVIPRPLSGTTDGIYPVADPKYFKNPFYHKS